MLLKMTIFMVMVIVLLNAYAHITYKFDVKKPTEITVSKFDKVTLSQETLNRESFQTPL
jgi:hypothetical protein